MISIEHISFSYGEKKVFEDFSLDIKNGDRICLFGESGCGKTTLLRIIAGLSVPDGGTVKRAEGFRPSEVFQDNLLLPFKTVLRNITLTGSDKTTALAHLAALGIDGCADKYPSELSGGMQRRAAIARALSAEYSCLLLDEPFAGLDAQNISSAAAHISESLGDRTLVLVTHDKPEAEMLGCRIVEIS